MRKLRCGIIGAGIMGNLHLKACKQFPYSEPIAVCDTNEKKAEETAEKFGVKAYNDYLEMLNSADVEVIHITTPDFAHRDPTIKSLESGKHVIVEKPMATTMDDAKAIFETAKSSRCKLMVNFSNRWNPTHHNTKKAIENGDLGEIKHAYARLSNTTYVPKKMLSWASKSSPTMFLLPHVVDLVRWFFSSEAGKVYAVKTEGVLKSIGIDTHDTMTAIVNFSNGAVACFETSWILPESAPYMVDHYVKVMGSKGITYVDNRKQGLEKYWERAEYPGSFATETMDGCGKGFAYDSIYHFLDCVLNDKAPISNEYDGLMNTAVICAMLDSAQMGISVNVKV
jgi:predicted dehydrogenase